MVKISSSAKNMRQAGKNVDYISRQGRVVPEPFREALVERRQAVLVEYGAVAHQLVSGDSDARQLAVDITQFAQALPPVRTQRDQRVAELEQARVVEVERGPER